MVTDIWVCRFVLKICEICTKFRLCFLSFGRVGSNRRPPEPDLTQPLFFTVGGGSAVLQPNRVELVPG